ncbi:MAG: ScyD/ScyE family protein [Chitinophagaceae bacterium]
MKLLLFQALKIKSSLLYMTLIVSIVMLASSCKKNPPESKLKITILAAGLKNPIGVELYKNGGVLVAEGGTGNNDGKVVLITPDGKKADLITGFPSLIFEGDEPDGPTHLLLSDGVLYVLGTGRKMYKVNAFALKPGAPLKASDLSVENIGAFVLGQGFLDSHPYGIVAGPGGDLYIADAGANAIIHRGKTGTLSILAKVPGIPNPTPVGPPQIESVPTGIIYDGQNFFATTLLGFPFPPGKSLIYKISPAGMVSVFQQGFTSLVDIAAGGSLGRLVLGHGTFGTMGFAPNSGTLTWANGSSATLLAGGLNLPAGLKQADAHTWYVTSLGDGTVSKVEY